jgi:hypothetical protein
LFNLSTFAQNKFDQRPDSVVNLMVKTPAMHGRTQPKTHLAFVLIVVLATAAAGISRCESASAPPPNAASASIPAGAPAALPSAGHDFGAEARLLFRVAACTGNAPIPESLDRGVIERHCSELLPLMRAYHDHYLSVMGPYLAKLRPEGLPPTVVYPFGGGDLLSALTVYPDATEITTLSLEGAGDPRRAAALNSAALKKDLARLRNSIQQLLTLSDSASEDLIQVHRGGIPGQLSFFLVGLAIHGYEPVSLRYFRVEPDGSLHYLDDADIAALASIQARKLNRVWKSPDFSLAFSNLELTFRPMRIGPPSTHLRVHRHIAADLGDTALSRDPGVLRYLEGRGAVACVIKAASYLLWSVPFGRIRDYLLTHADFMISDSSGIPPCYAQQAGFVQQTYGTFEGSYIRSRASDESDFVRLWRSQPHREMPLRFGYGDVHKAPHLVVTCRTSRMMSVSATAKH